jgi:CDP-glucose 4,6-dehydratase
MDEQESPLENMEGLKYTNDFWLNKKVFVTGHTGFKGVWLCLWLNKLGAKVKGYSLPPEKNSPFYDDSNLGDLIESEYGDIRDYVKLENSIKVFEPQIIFHLAAQALVIDSYLDPVNTFSTNILGTVNLLQISKELNSLKSIVVVTTDKCYENDESKISFNELDKLGGSDPYSSSKSCCELVVNSYRDSYLKKNNILIATARAGNVIGGGDYSSNRLIPDLLKALVLEKEVVIRNPKSVRPWQHVLNPLEGYLILAENLFNGKSQFQGSWNFGPNIEDCKDVKWIVDNFNSKLKTPIKVVLKENNENFKEAGFLFLDCTKAINNLNWNPIWDLEDAIKSIIRWQETLAENKNIQNFCINEIEKYIKHGERIK